MIAPIERADFIKDEHLTFLDVLRKTAVTNMLGGGPYLRDQFPGMTKRESLEIVRYWVRTLGEEDR